MSDAENFSIINTTRISLPGLSGIKPLNIFSDIKNAALGKKYDLSLVFIGNTRSRKLNKNHRGIDKPTNILSFNLSEKSGEIFIDLPLSIKQSRKFDRSPDNFIFFLFIHGLLHLKGFDHGDTMEEAEQKLRKKFKI